MASLPKPQDMFLYTARWTKEIDDDFIDLLEETANSLGDEFKTHLQMTLKMARIFINHSQVTQFSGKEIYDKWLKLKKRYCVFNELRCMSGVYYNPYTNLVELVEGAEVLHGIAKERKFYVAYTTHGEPQLNSLERIVAYKNPIMPVTPVMEVSQPIEPPVILQNNHQMASTSTPTTDFGNTSHSLPSVDDDNFWADLSGYDPDNYNSE